MIKLKVNMPWGGSLWEFEVSAVPRLGEHVQLSGITYVCVEIRHVLNQNEVLISLRNADRC